MRKNTIAKTAFPASSALMSDVSCAAILLNQRNLIHCSTKILPVNVGAIKYIPILKTFW